MRLVNRDKDIIRSAMLVRRFKATALALIAHEREILRALYKRLYTEENQKELQRAANGKFPEVDRLSAQFGGTYDQLQLNKKYRVGEDIIAMEEAPELRVWYKHKASAVMVLDALDPLTADRRNFEADVKDFREELSKAGKLIAAALAPITTDKMLIETWPEAAEFLPKGKQRLLLPAVPREELNNLLGLETKE